MAVVYKMQCQLTKEYVKQAWKFGVFEKNSSDKKLKLKKFYLKTQANPTKNSIFGNNMLADSKFMINFY